MLSLIAIVGEGAYIGSTGSVPVFADPEERARVEAQAMAATAGGHLIVGRATAELMTVYGRSIDDPIGDRTVTVWTRALDLTVPEFIIRAEETGRPVFVIGGQTTFRLFAPFCETLILMRAQLKPAAGYPLTMPPLLPEWEAATHATPDFRQ